MKYRVYKVLRCYVDIEAETEDEACQKSNDMYPEEFVYTEETSNAERITSITV